MTEVVGEWTTVVRMAPEEAKEVCRLGEGEKCCAFLVVGKDGFECIRMSSPTIILDRLKKGTMNAKGEGGWDGCAWHGTI